MAVSIGFDYEDDLALLLSWGGLDFSLIDAAGAVVAAGAAFIVLAGAPAPPIVAGVSPLGRVVFIITNL